MAAEISIDVLPDLTLHPGDLTSADSLVACVEAARPEVFVTAAWALRRLAVPDSLPGAAAYVKAECASLARQAAEVTKVHA